uniref:Uncharacterized protein n=1 Tax=Anguilla anguilla TaxID=7936 RepID=A0A0E9SFS1_ANGAN
MCDLVCLFLTVFVIFSSMLSVSLNVHNTVCYKCLSNQGICQA